MDQKRYNILIVEDLPTWQKSLHRFLKREPFNVMIAANFQQGLALALYYPVDVLLLDVNLTGVPYNVDGLRLAEQVYQRNSSVKIIIICGSQEWLRRLPAYNFSPTFIIEKQNLEPDDLLAKIYQSLKDQSWPAIDLDG